MSAQSSPSPEPLRDWPVVTCEKVRYGDLDPFGHLNNTVFFRFFEQARIAYFARIGLYGPQGRGDENLILAETRCRFIAEGHLDDEVHAAARMVRVGNASCEMGYRLARGATIIAEGDAVLVYYDFVKRCSLRIPDSVRERIDAVEGRRT